MKKASKTVAEFRLTVDYWPVDRLQPYEKNPRKNDEVVDRMVGSIKEFGFTVPVLARSTGEVIDGHLRLKAASKLKYKELPVIVCDDWSDAQVKAFRLMANRSVAWASWDLEALKVEFTDLKDLEFDLSLTGFEPLEYGDLSGVNFKEYDENTAADVKYIECPECGHSFPK